MAKKLFKVPVTIQEVILVSADDAESAQRIALTLSPSELEWVIRLDLDGATREVTSITDPLAQVWGPSDPFREIGDEDRRTVEQMITQAGGG